MQLEKHSQVRPSQDKRRLFIFDFKHLRTADPKGNIAIVTTYSPHLNIDLPISFASGETRQFLATADRVFDVNENPPKWVPEAKIDLWSDSPIAVFGSQQSLAYLSNAGFFCAQGVATKVKGAKGIYSGSDTDYLYVATEESLMAYDVKARAVVRKLPVSGAKNVAVVNSGEDVLFAHATNVLSLYDRDLSKSKFELKFNSHQSIWALDLCGDHLAVVTWEGVALSAKWIVRLFDISTKKEVKTLEYNHPVTCFVLQGNVLAIVGEREIRWETW